MEFVGLQKIVDTLQRRRKGRNFAVIHSKIKGCGKKRGNFLAVCDFCEKKRRNWGKGAIRERGKESY